MKFYQCELLAFFFFLLDTPVSVHEKLKKIVGFASKDFEYLPYEDDAEDTYSYDTPRYIHLHGLEYDILDELKVRNSLVLLVCFVS